MITPQLSRHDRTPVTEAAQWFRNALGEWRRQPSSEQIETLAREFQVLLNRANNDQRAEGPNPPALLELKDVDPQQVLSDNLHRVQRAGRALLLQLDRLEKTTGNRELAGLTRRVSIEEVREVLVQIGSLRGDDDDPIPSERGQPRKAWHGVARQLAPRVVRLLRALGCEARDVSPKEASSATACICAKALSWAYCEKITAEGFVNALRERGSRSKSRPQFSEMTFDQIFSAPK